jgi:hypothetical protein
MPVSNLLIAAPAYGGAVKTGCVQSLLKLQAVLMRDRRLPMTLDFTSFADVTTVRNLFGTLAAEGSRHSHVLFVDTDMVFEPEAVLKLIDADLPLVGCFYPMRDPSGRVVGSVSEPVVVPDSGLVKVDALGMGLCLIDVDCFRKLRATGKLAELTGHPFEDRVAGPLLGFFSADPDGAYVSEDYAFCRRWRDLCGGEVWALVREDIGHVGDHVFRRNLDAKVLIPTQFLGAPAQARRGPAIEEPSA